MLGCAQSVLFISPTLFTSADDGDISSAPVSSRRGVHHTGGYHAPHTHTQSDASMTAPTSATSASGYAQSNALQATRLANLASQASAGFDDTGLQSGEDSAAASPAKHSSGSSTHAFGNPPESPAPQLPHAPQIPHGSGATHSQLNSPSRSSHRELLVPSIHTPPRTRDPKSQIHGKEEEAVHHPAPHGFLAKMSALDLQESVRQAIAGAGADGVQRNYSINPPPKDRPVRIYADGVYDLVCAHYNPRSYASRASAI